MRREKAGGRMSFQKGSRIHIKENKVEKRGSRGEERWRNKGMESTQRDISVEGEGGE
jgi:hypothetical protein